MNSLDVVIEVSKALRDWDGSPEDAAERLDAAVKAVQSFSETNLKTQNELGVLVSRIREIEQGSGGCNMMDHDEAVAEIKKFFKAHPEAVEQ